jgi:hypothetical protein
MARRHQGPRHHLPSRQLTAADKRNNNLAARSGHKIKLKG